MLLPEEQVRCKVHDYLVSRHIWHFVYVANVTYGIPDIIAIYRGYFVGIELKREDKRGVSTELQRAIINELREAGGFGAIVETVEDVEHLLNEVDNVYTKAVSNTGT